MDKQSEIKISIVIPVYNVGEYLDRFLKCLEFQTFNNFVAIFVDDKSTDNSLRIIENYKNYSKNQVVILKNHENKGQGETRNVGIDYVNAHPTKYLAFLDPDDWMDSDYLEDLFCTAETEHLDVCMSGVERFDEDDERTICKEMIKMQDCVFERPEDCDELAFINPCLYSKIFIFEKVKDIRFNNMRRSEDTCYFFEAMVRCKRFKFTNNAKYHYCVRNSSLTGKISMDTYYSMHDGFTHTLSLFSNRKDILKDIFVSQIFIRSSIGGVCRISFNNLRKAQYLERLELQFLNEKVPEWKHCRYLNFHKINHGGLKGLALIICACLYKLHIFFLFVWFYWFVSQILRVEIRM